MTSKEEKYDALEATTELSGGPDDPNPFVKDDKPAAEFYENLSDTERALVDMVTANRRIEKRLDKMGIEATGVHESKMTFMLEWIINNVLTHAQREDMTLAWATHYNQVLKDLEVKGRELIVAQQRARLSVPKSSSLVVPPGVRRPGS